MAYDVELVGKIGSMALIDNLHHEIDYNCFLRISRFLHPGVIWVSSGATEIGRLDYIRKNGCELEGGRDEVKTDYAAQGQPLLMKIYGDFINPKYSVRQVLIEHTHFNDEEKRAHIKDMLLRHSAASDATVYLTLEPHLTDFVGLKDLENGEISARVGGYSYKNNDEAFDAAVTALKGLLAK